MSLGFMKPSQKIPFAHPSSFGMLGFGGCFGFADPHAEFGFAYVPNRTDFYLMDPRQNALRMAMYRSIGETNPFLLQGRSRTHMKSTEYSDSYSNAIIKYTAR